VVAVGMACARPGSASVTLGNAVVLRMNSMDGSPRTSCPSPRTSY
jgi:hypothetical protein